MECCRKQLLSAQRQRLVTRNRRQDHRGRKNLSVKSHHLVTAWKIKSLLANCMNAMRGQEMWRQNGYG
jgi:hypothetical protein